MHKQNTLLSLGWNSFFETYLSQLSVTSGFPARVTGTYQHLFRLNGGENAEFLAEISGKMEFDATSREDFPVIGDWVLVQYEPHQEKGLIISLFPRQTLLSRLTKTSRKTKGSKGIKQVLAANIDLAFIVVSANQDFNLRRIERYFTLVSNAGIQPVILLTKSELAESISDIIEEIRSVVFSTPIHAVSAYDDSGKEGFLNYLIPGSTGVLLGSSGVGKSTLINWLLGEDLIHTKEISDYKDQGTHTTTNRLLISLEGAGMIIDTPGIRELTFDAEDSDLSESFSDIEELEKNCSYRNCSHFNEPGCAVLEAIGNGRLDSGRFENYQKIKMESLKHQVKMGNHKDKKRAQKNLTKTYKKILKDKQGRTGKY